jgi:Ca-activated chloride channel family protein
MLKSGYATVVRVDRVIVPAVVTDKKGRPIQGLTEKDFQLTENNVPQKIDYFHVDSGDKVSIAFLLDVSSSMRLMDKIGEAREAILYFLNRLGPGDRASLMIFADGEIQQLAPFGTDPQAIIRRLDAIKAYGQTALHDAIAAAPTQVDKQEGGRKAIVLITDGVDNASKLSLYEAMSAARRVDVPIYSIGFAGSVETSAENAQGTNAEVLKLISDETGGTFFWINDPDELKEAIHSVEEDLRSQYVLGYTPPQRCDGVFHRIELKASRNRYKIRTRKGYVAGPC